MAVAIDRSCKVIAEPLSSNIHVMVRADRDQTPNNG